MMGKILKLIRELKNISLREIASTVGVSFAAIAQVERGLPSLAVEKIKEIAKVYGISEITEDRVVFDCEKLHYLYIPISYRVVQWDYFYSFLSVVTPVETIFFTQKKFVVAIGIKDINECIFLFLPRTTPRLCKTKNVQDIIEKSLKKTFTKTIDITELDIDLKKLNKADIEKHFDSVYCYSCPRLAIETPDGNIIYKPVVPISTILKDFHDYLEHEKNLARKRYAIESLISYVWTRILKNFNVNEYFTILEELNCGRRLGNAQKHCCTTSRSRKRRKSRKGDIHR